MSKFAFGTELENNNAVYDEWYDRIAVCCETGNFGEARCRLKFLEEENPKMADEIAHEISVEYNYVLR